MKAIAAIGLVLISIAACVAMLFVRALEPTSIGAYLFFSIWLAIPYAAMAVALVLLERSRSPLVGGDVHRRLWRPSFPGRHYFLASRCAGRDCSLDNADPPSHRNDSLGSCLLVDGSAGPGLTHSPRVQHD